MSADSTSYEKRQTLRSRLANILDNATRSLRAAGTRPEPEDPSVEPRHVTRKGNEITRVSESKWFPDDTGVKEFKHHVGRSVEGYHGGLQISHQGGEGPFYWSNARRTPQAAERASYGIRDWYGRDDGVKPEKRLEAGVEQSIGKVRKEFGKQRGFVAREIAEGDAYLKKLAPDYKPRKKTPSWDR